MPIEALAPVSPQGGVVRAVVGGKERAWQDVVGVVELVMRTGVHGVAAMALWSADHAVAPPPICWLSRRPFSPVRAPASS